MNIYKTVLIFFLLIFGLQGIVFSQQKTIQIDSLEIGGTLLFEKYKPIGKKCFRENGNAKHCKLEEKLFDNNIEDLELSLENTLSYLIIPYELISEKDIDKAIYSDSTFYRYILKAKPKLSEFGNSCFSNPGALIMEFYAYDRIEKQLFLLDIKYAFYTCDVQLMVNLFNKKARKEAKAKKK